MCGIAGFVDKSGVFSQQDRERIVGTMLKLMKHRGGDAIGVESFDVTTIGHTRLAILDSRSCANQPRTNRSSILAFNGEIYNHLNLRSKYCKHEIVSYSDTATLFELLRILPITKVLKQIQGMYAFSYLDKKEGLLTLALDKFSIKPLYYVETAEYFAWASEIKAFKAIPDFSFQFNDSCLEEYLCFRYVSGERTLFKNIYKLCAGEYLVYLTGSQSFKKERYYKIEAKTFFSTKNFSESILEKSVRAELMSDMPVGVQLSGGVDSSLVALFAKKTVRTKLHTFSVGLRDESWNEFKYSDFVSKLLNTEHHKVFFSKHDFIRLFRKVTYHLDEPIVHPNTIPMYVLSKQARKYTKVLLTGEGADEIFYGYNRYLESKVSSKEELYLSNVFSKPSLVFNILKNKSLFWNEREAVLKNAWCQKKEKRMAIYDLYTYLPHVLLRQDKTGMAANIENRVPFLYEPIVESSWDLPKFSTRFGGKTPLKKIALKYFPKDFVLRKKCGFGLPVADWLKEDDALKPLLQDLKNDPFIQEYFVVSELRNIIKEHLVGNADHSGLLFSIIALVVWHKTFFR